MKLDVNKRFVLVGIALGVIVVVAVLLGSPYFLGFDLQR